MESKRQIQVAKLIQQSVSEVFQIRGSEFYGGAFVTISGVLVTPDLMVAKVHLSVYNVKEKQEVVDLVNKNISRIRGDVGKKIRNKVRVIPHIEFHLDQSLEEVYQLETFFEKNKYSDEEEE